MEITDILNYVMSTPENTNRAVLEDMLLQLSNGSEGGLPSNYTWKFTQIDDKEWISDTTPVELFFYLYKGVNITCEFTDIKEGESTTVFSRVEVGSSQPPSITLLDIEGENGSVTTEQYVGNSTLVSLDTFYIYHE